MTNSTTRDEFEAWASPTLRRCPFCNGCDVRLVSDGEGDFIANYVQCDCGAEGPTRGSSDYAIALWNRRNPLDVAFKAGMDVTRGDIAQLQHEHAMQVENLRAEGLLAMQAARRAALLEAAKVCEDERLKYSQKASANDGRDSDFAFGSVHSLEFIAEHLRALADEGMKD